MRYFVEASESRHLDASSRRGLRGSFIELSDGLTHYEITGPEDGDVVVLTGGLTVPLFYWDGVVKELHDRGLRTLAFSAYGRGYSQRVQARYDSALFVRQLTELIDELVPGRHHVVGTSMGALIAMEYLAEARDVTTLTLVGPAGLTGPSPMGWLLKSDPLASLVGKHLGRRLLAGHMGHNVSDQASASALKEMVLDAFQYEGSMYALISTLQNMPLHGRSELFRSTGDLGVPTLLIWGEDDQVTPIASLEEARTLLRPRQCHVITQCGHMAPLERPTEVAHLVASFTTNPTERLQREDR